MSVLYIVNSTKSPVDKQNYTESHPCSTAGLINIAFQGEMDQTSGDTTVNSIETGRS